VPRAPGHDALTMEAFASIHNRQDGPRSLGTRYACTNLVNGAEGLTGNCKACGMTLERALVREVRHFEETRLLEVTCGGCERRFLAIRVETAAIDALKMEDVAEAADQLAWARSLSDLFSPRDLDLSDGV
jgi:hypothetical protein